MTDLAAARRPRGTRIAAASTSTCARAMPAARDGARGAARRATRRLAGTSVSFRPTGPSIVLALHDGPIDFATLPFVNVAELFQRVPLPVPAVLGHSDALGILALQDLGDVTLQAHVGAGTPTEHAALYRQAISLIAPLQRRGAELASDAYRPYRHRVRRREADVGARFLRAPFRRGISRRRAVGGRNGRRWPRSGRRSPASWPPSRACSAIATTTAAT